jgi:hypothetical protein
VGFLGGGGAGFIGPDSRFFGGNYALGGSCLVHLQDVDMMSKPVQQCAGEAIGAEDFGPFFERKAFSRLLRRQFFAIDL